MGQENVWRFTTVSGVNLGSADSGGQEDSSSAESIMVFDHQNGDTFTSINIEQQGRCALIEFNLSDIYLVGSGRSDLCRLKWQPTEPVEVGYEDDYTISFDANFKYEPYYGPIAAIGFNIAGITDTTTPRYEFIANAGFLNGGVPSTSSSLQDVMDTYLVEKRGVIVTFYRNGQLIAQGETRPDFYPRNVEMDLVSAFSELYISNLTLVVEDAEL